MHLSEKQNRWYQSALERFATSARSHAWNDGGGFWDVCKVAAKLGVSWSQLEADCRNALGADFTMKHMDCLRRTFGNAVKKHGGASVRPPVRPSFRPSAPKVATHPGTVKRLIALGGGEADEAAVLALSPYAPSGNAADTLAQIGALFSPDDFLFVTAKGAAWGELGYNVRTRDEWERLIAQGGALPGDLVGIVPVASGCVRHMDGTRGVGAGDLSARQPYAVLEMDDCPLGAQCAFVAGLLKSEWGPRVVSVVHSAGRSLHAVVDLRLSEGTRQGRIEDLRAHFASDPETTTAIEDGETKTVYPYRVDANGLLPNFKTRLGGVVRADNRTLQRLLYLNPAASGAM